MRLAEFIVVGSVVAAFSLTIGTARARELDYLQTDPRFSGGEVNPSNPGHQNFWFYDQYSAARTEIQKAGVNMIPVTSITLTSLDADSDAFYVPAPTNPQASTYPMTDQEISVIQQYVASERSVIFNLGNGASAAMDDNLFMRLGLGGMQAPATISGGTSYPLPNQPIVVGGYGAVSSFTYSGTGYMSSLGSMRSLVDAGGDTVIAYVEKGDLGPKEGGYFFILDQSYLTNWSSESTSQQNLFMNMVIYATNPQYTHYVPPSGSSQTLTLSISAVPEPLSMAWIGGATMLLLGRARRSRTQSSYPRVSQPV